MWHNMFGQLCWIVNNRKHKNMHFDGTHHLRYARFDLDFTQICKTHLIFFKFLFKNTLFKIIFLHLKGVLNLCELIFIWIWISEQFLFPKTFPIMSSEWPIYCMFPISRIQLNNTIYNNVIKPKAINLNKSNSVAPLIS